jgi:membrane-bound acyltransferase YfiQ involved in biofilm formation
MHIGEVQENTTLLVILLILITCIYLCIRKIRSHKKNRTVYLFTGSQVYALKKVDAVADAAIDWAWECVKHGTV